jgi:hypothetical protein
VSRSGELADVVFAARAHLCLPRIADMGVVLPDDELRALPVASEVGQETVERVRHVGVPQVRGGDVGGEHRPVVLRGALSGLSSREARVTRTPRPGRPAITTSRLDRVAVASAMHLGIFACPPNARPREVAAILVDKRVHCVAVAETPAPASWKFITDVSVARSAAEGRDVRAADLVGEATWIAGDAALDGRRGCAAADPDALKVALGRWCTKSSPSSTGAREGRACFS